MRLFIPSFANLCSAIWLILHLELNVKWASGLSDYVYGPPGMHQDPFDSCDLAGNREAQMVLIGAVKDLLQRTGVLLPRFLLEQAEAC